MNQDQQIGFQGGDEDEMPPEMKDHMLKAYAHAAGLGPHPGMYKGPSRSSRDPDEITDTDRQRAEEEPLEDHPTEHEAQYQKMRAAAMGGPAGAQLGPSEFQQQQVRQATAMQRQAATQAAMQAQQAQGQKAPISAPQAPAGPQGVTTPEPAQARSQVPQDVTGAPPSEQGQPPEAPSGPAAATNP